MPAVSCFSLGWIHQEVDTLDALLHQEDLLVQCINSKEGYHGVNLTGERVVTINLVAFHDKDNTT